MRAADIAAELRTVPHDGLATVEAYERAHKNRSSVLNAADRRRRVLSGQRTRRT
jgi:hypothetical protein